MRSPVTIAFRKPDGCGKAAQQKFARNRKASVVAYFLLDRLDLEAIQMTGQLMPRGSLKRRQNRQIFDWVGQFNGRTFTSQLVRLVIKKLMRMVGQIPLDPKVTYGAYVKQQSKILRKLIRQAKRLKDSGFGKNKQKWLNVMHIPLRFSRFRS